MLTRTLGNTDLRCSIITLGGNVFGRFCNASETKAIISSAEQLGINCIDTADVYSDGLSEEFIGRALGKRRNQWVLCSKVGQRSDEVSAGLGARDRICSKIDGTLRRLRTDCIDLYQLHNYDPTTPLAESVATFEDLIRAGKIRHYGVSNFSLSQMQQVAALDGSMPASLQVEYNLLRRGALELFPFCQSNAVGVLVYGVLARGVLTGKYSSQEDLPVTSRAAVSESIRSDITPEALRMVAKLKVLADRHGATTLQAALAWALSRGEISSLVVGVRTPEQLDEVAGVGRVSIPKEDLQQL